MTKPKISDSMKKVMTFFNFFIVVTKSVVARLKRELIMARD